MNRRGKNKNVKVVNKSLVFGGVNPDGAKGKWATIKKAVRDTGASVWTMQETKCSIEGKLKLDGFVTYELLRSHGGGGGLALSARTELNPAFVQDGGDKVEALTVDIHMKQMTISCTTAYGPQESDKLEKKNLFWEYLTETAVDAKDEGKGFILQGDLNAWLGSKIIPGDKRIQNKNGKMFEDFLSTNDLTVVNSLPICKGVNTRVVLRKNKLIESVLDFYVVCQRVLQSVVNMEIDVDRKYIVTNFNKVRKGGNITDSDHLTSNLTVNFKVIPQKPHKIVTYNFRDKEGQEAFKESTSNTEEFSKCFMNNNHVNLQATDWMKVLMTHIDKAFPKIRIISNNIKPSSASKLINIRNSLIIAKKEDSEEFKKITIEIADILAEESKSKAYRFRKFCDQGNTLNVTEMWKLKKKLWPKKKCALPVAKRNHQGKMVSSPHDLRSLLLKEYKERLRTRPCHPDMKVIKPFRNKLIKIKLKVARQNQTKPFKMQDLDKVL